MKYVKTYEALEKKLKKLSKYPDLQKLYKNTFLSTLETTTKILDDGTTYVFTGDIPAMWLRDSSAQVQHYIKYVNIDPDMKRLITGLLKRQFMYITIDPYANSFNETPDPSLGYVLDQPKTSPWVWERKFELDSLCYPVWLLNLYYKESKDKDIFTKEIIKGLKKVLETIEIELDHDNKSKYWFWRPTDPADSLENHGKGTPTNNEIKLVWSGYRPSDDALKYHYFIPGNQFVVVALNIISDICPDSKLAKKAEKLSKEIDDAIRKHGVYDHPKYGKIFIYETDGLGNYNIMDDANIPSLLAMPYIGYSTIDDPIYQNTRRFALSKDNPFYYSGKLAKGVGSPHTPKDYIWHISLVAQGLTTNDISEKRYVLRTLLSSHDNTFHMHEGFHVDDPSKFTREWFSWSDSMCALFIEKNIDIIDELLK